METKGVRPHDEARYQRSAARTGCRVGVAGGNPYDLNPAAKTDPRATDRAKPDHEKEPCRWLWYRLRRSSKSNDLKPMTDLCAGLRRQHSLCSREAFAKMRGIGPVFALENVHPGA